VGHLNTVLSASVTTLPEIFHAAGYRTAMVCSNTIMGAEFGFAQGAEIFATLRPDDTGKTKLGYLVRRLGVERGIAPFAAAGSALRAVENALPGAADRDANNLTADQVVGEFLRWRGSIGQAPFFAYLHFMEPHGPYRPPEPYGRRFLSEGEVLVDSYPRSSLLFLPFARADSVSPAQRGGMIAAYEGEIAALDRTLGRLLDELLADSRPTIVMITADHGEEFHEHGGWGHGHSLLQDQLSIPCVVAGAGVPIGRLVPGNARLVDLGPTLLDLAELSPRPEMAGRSWVESIRTDAPPPAGEVLSEIVYNDAYWSRALRAGSWKIVQGRLGEEESTQLFDLERDPGEMRDRAREDSTMCAALAERLDQVVDAARRGATEEVTAEFDPVTMERLRALGYVH
jgi:arylsulfatase A-like enzyme